MSSTTQEGIKKWFDKTYLTKGFRYLRPIDAYEIFATALDVQPGSKHLDVASGLGLLAKCFANKEVNVDGIDLSPEAVSMAKEYCPEAHFQQGNAEQLPFQDRTFDTVTCIGSIERMLDREKALQEQHRVLKDGGKLCLMVRNSENFTWRFIKRPFGLINKEGHQDALNRDEWTKLVERSGFTIQQTYPDHWPYYRLLKTIMPWRKIDTSRIINFPYPLELAYEFIFVLQKSK